MSSVITRQYIRGLSKNYGTASRVWKNQSAKDILVHLSESKINGETKQTTALGKQERQEVREIKRRLADRMPGDELAGKVYGPYPHPERTD